MPRLNYRSSKTHRSVTRTSAGCEILNTTLKGISLSSTIPVKVSQVCASLFGAFHKSTKPPERIFDSIQAAITLSQVGMLISMAYWHENCEKMQNNLCTSYFVLEWLYQGLLLSAWGLSEFVKDTDEFSPQTSPLNLPS